MFNTQQPQWAINQNMISYKPPVCTNLYTYKTKYQQYMRIIIQWTVSRQTQADKQKGTDIGQVR